MWCETNLISLFFCYRWTYLGVYITMLPYWLSGWKVLMSTISLCWIWLAMKTLKGKLNKSDVNVNLKNPTCTFDLEYTGWLAVWLYIYFSILGIAIIVYICGHGLLIEFNINLNIIFFIAIIYKLIPNCCRSTCITCIHFYCL